jgi:hypothetical protein
MSVVIITTCEGGDPAEIDPRLANGAVAHWMSAAGVGTVRVFRWDQVAPCQVIGDIEIHCDPGCPVVTDIVAAMRGES